MKKTPMPVIGGILSIISGALDLLAVFGIGIAIIVVPSNLGILLLTIGAFLLVVSILPIIGGIFAIKRQKWGLALAGSILAILGSLAFGIAATVLVALSQDEFE